MFTLTYTNMRTFRDCPQRFKYAHLDCLRPVVVSKALFIGRLFHLYREKGAEGVSEALKDYFPSTQAEMDDLEVTKAILKGMAVVAPKDEGVQREIEWNIPLVNPDTNRHSRTFRLGGKADGMLPLERGYALIEEKTASSVTKSDIDKLPIDSQVLNAITCLEDSGAWQVREVWYRYFRKPSIRQKKGETVTQFEERVVADYHTRPEFYFHEERLIIPRDVLETFRRDRWHTAKMILWTKGKDLWYKNTSKCADWGGCPYLPLCRGEDAMDLYVRSERNPELDREESRNGFTGEQE